MVKLTAEQLSWLYPYDKPCTTDEKRIKAAHEFVVQVHTEALNKQVLHLDDDSHDGLRCSAMGHHPLDIIGRKFFPRFYDLTPGSTISPRMQQLFLDGDVFEAHYIFWLLTRDYDIRVSVYQGDVCWRGKVTGHFDVIVQLPDGTFVLLELKTCNQNYFQSLQRQRDWLQVAAKYGKDYSFLTTEMSDFRGHITQAALYQDCLKDGLFAPDATVVVVKDKNTASLLLYQIPEENEELLTRVQEIVNIYDSVNSWEEAVFKIKIPDPKLELRNRQRTSRYLLPPALYSSPVVPLLYEWVGDKQTYILGYALPDTVYPTIAHKIKQSIQDIAADGSFGVYTYSMDDVESRIEDWLDYQYERSMN